MNRTVIITLFVIAAIAAASLLLIKNDPSSPLDSNIESNIVDPAATVSEVESALPQVEEKDLSGGSIHKNIGSKSIESATIQSSDADNAANKDDEIDPVYDDPNLRIELGLDTPWSDTKIQEVQQRAALAEQEFFGDGSDGSQDLSISDPAKYERILKQAEEAETALFKEYSPEEVKRLQQNSSRSEARQSNEITYEEQERLQGVADEQEKKLAPLQ